MEYLIPGAFENCFRSAKASRYKWRLGVSHAAALQDRQRIMITARIWLLTKGVINLYGRVDTLEVGFCVDGYLIDDYC